MKKLLVDHGVWVVIVSFVTLMICFLTSGSENEQARLAAAIVFVYAVAAIVEQAIRRRSMDAAIYVSGAAGALGVATAIAATGIGPATGIIVVGLVITGIAEAIVALVATIRAVPERKPVAVAVTLATMGTEFCILCLLPQWVAMWKGRV